MEAEGGACGERGRNAGRGGAQGRGALQVEDHRAAVRRAAREAAGRKPHRRADARHHAAPVEAEQRQGVDIEKIAAIDSVR